MAKDERPYARIDLGLPTNRKLRGLDVRAKWLYISTLLWCGQSMNDGVFDPRIAIVVADVPIKSMHDLVARGLWHEKGHVCPECPQPADAGDLVVHDYMTHNRPAERIRKLRADRKLAGRKANHDRWQKSGHEDHQSSFEECEKCND